MNQTPIPILGIDIGHTIYNNPEHAPFPDAFRVVRRLAQELFGSKNVYIVSRVTPEQEVRARDFINSDAFQKEAGIPITQIRFCRERYEKGHICAGLGITHFIDDQPEVIAAMPRTVTFKLLFRPLPENVRLWREHVENVLIVESWKEVEGLLLPPRS